MMENGMSTPIIPLTWLRDPAFLLRTAKSQKDGLTSEEQKVAVHRLLCLICQRAHDEGLNLQGELSYVLRKITEEDRRKIYQIAKKFLQGMTAGQPHHGFDYADFLPRFKKGEFDNLILHTTSPALTGRYWPWIKEAQAEACKVADAAAAAKLQEMADEAEMAARIAEQEATAAVTQHITDTDKAQQAKAAADMDVRDKLQIAYQRQVHMFAHKQTSVLEDIWSRAEE